MDSFLSYLITVQAAPAQQFILLHTLKQWNRSKHDLNSFCAFKPRRARRLEYNGKREIISITPTVTMM